MNILITGITGLFGSYLAAEFASLGKIIGLRRANSSTRLLDQKNLEITWREADLGDPSQLESAMEDVDLVIHSAGMVSFFPSDSDQLYQTNVIGTRNLVNAMLDKGVKKLIHISSVAAIGRSTELTTINEKFKWTESPLNTDYARSKYEGELEVWRGEQEGLEVLVINPSVILGKIADDRSSTSIYSYVLEEKSYYPKGDINYIDARDAAKITRLLFEKEAWGERFILNAGSISYQEFFKQMAQSFGKKAPQKPVTPLLLNLAVWYAGFSRWIGASKIPLNSSTARISQLSVNFDNTKVKKALGYEFRPLLETFNWAK
ncbi:NAD-dependent epimerase/dehydratase family protein [Algoriphagus kandeliae]|uniref:NAD-dependent epimerase/dehydratase family protein n=1 Tax=Algoriphagus kandeliae TaxID=2562278 RepID=A0A4Y9QV47_9BACT|nr:NAD-dependent epimerase/dehydratase family protein [Algoriphagus kandeliae]TFV95598.1 NAD-dependent epimerase/dehydratase family protein [Algoriphagus kandeliae]